MFVVALCALFAFGNEARSQDLGGLKLNQSIVALLTRETGHAGNVLEVAKAVGHADGRQARPSGGDDDFQSNNDMAFLYSQRTGVPIHVAGPQLNGLIIEGVY